MSAELLQVYIGLLGLILALVGLPLLFAQLRDLKRSVQSSAHAALYAQGADFRAHLIEYPHLRKYFFGAADITPEHEDYDRVVTIAELFLNHLEHIAVLGDSFGRENRPGLDRFCTVALERSPILRKHLEQNRSSYSDSLQRFLPLARPSGQPPVAARRDPEISASYSNPPRDSDLHSNVSVEADRLAMQCEAAG